MQKSIPKVKSLSQNGEISSSKLEQLKDIIFGENIQEYDSEFEAVRLEIQNKKVELEKLINEVKTDLDTMIDNMSTDINIRLTELSEKINEQSEELDENKVDKQTLGKLLTTLGEKIAQG